MSARWCATALGVLVVTLCLVAAAFALVNGHLAAAVAALVGVVVPTTGAIVARHVPRNPVGWCQLAAGFLGTVGDLGIEYAPVALAHGWVPWLTHALAWSVGLAWLPALATALVFTALWFPDGRVVVRGFRHLPAVGSVAVTGWSVGIGVETWSTPTRALVDDTATTPWSPWLVVAAVCGLTLVVLAVVAAVGLVVRWRRADPLGREQLKWVAAGLTLVLAFVVATEVTDLGAWQNTLGALSIAAVAVTMGVAVLRYRLYEIDRIVSRTVSYGLVLVVLGGVYAGIVLGVGALLPDRLGSFGVALATLAVSALFLPLSRRVRRAVDHRFNRRRVDAERLVVRFAEKTRHDVSDATTRAELLRTVTSVVQPTHASLWTVTR